jgi:imidazole glycerol phosphate synthase subunit HisF
MIEFGIYCYKEEIKLLIPPLFDMLDGRNDTHLGRPMDSATRYRDTEANQIITVSISSHENGNTYRISSFKSVKYSIVLQIFA